MKTSGMVYVFEGDGKGKTSAALGVAVRMLMNGKRVVWISWFKSLNWSISESDLPKYFREKLEMYWTGEGFYIRDGKPGSLAGKPVKTAKTNKATAYDTANPKEHKVAAERALLLAEKILSEKFPPDLVVLDEIIQALDEKLLKVNEVLHILRRRKQTHLVLTGRVAPKSIIREADLVTSMKKIKHPYDKGILAIKGLDY